MQIEDIKQKIPMITDRHLLAELAEKGVFQEIASGVTIMEPGKFIKMVPLVIEGAVKVLRVDEEGKELFLYYLYPGETCALSLTCCDASKASEVKAVAEEDTIILGVPVRVHEAWSEKYAQWKDFVTQTYQRRFQEMLKALDAVAFLKMDQRLALYILAKMKKFNSTDLQLTHQEIANELGTSREVISRLLKQLEKKKWIELGRNKIYVREDFEELIM
ncbi:Crp/Fnr family transcriptional regulator [Echinicola sp. CAU 1574]|uniref:Crp/Fnr family transcriptional regulator n=1 Tax=Echinicola arenosa TaxID=2774144 RepID=A0ABR9AG66_9BACT|nr:Crp/Fnr family transcriptional regulator [Echinicola arenosa]MBD8487645.1 Crp/Fnr family transcriptional regulator [Echinicola arenosa]